MLPETGRDDSATFVTQSVSCTLPATESSYSLVIVAIDFEIQIQIIFKSKIGCLFNSKLGVNTGGKIHAT